ncbi:MULTISPECIES: hypothetical protein [unclassified Caballeronia]|uniref:hypothetical protein n=1 Tax=unclassified Caballeronia TaxID=2646786 RepID=UPI002029749A|nr:MULTISPECIES: hypothetical protein [unclassified Caballeronia]
MHKLTRPTDSPLEGLNAEPWGKAETTQPAQPARLQKGPLEGLAFMKKKQILSAAPSYEYAKPELNDMTKAHYWGKMNQASPAEMDPGLARVSMSPKHTPATAQTTASGHHTRTTPQPQSFWQKCKDFFGGCMPSSSQADRIRKKDKEARQAAKDHYENRGSIDN